MTDFKKIEPELKKYIIFDFQRVWQTKDSKKSTTEDKISEIRIAFEKENYLVLTNYIIDNLKSPCYGDKTNYLLINYNGDLYKCTARDFNEENRVGFLSEDGKPMFFEDKIRRRENSQLSKSVCKECRIAPICGGGCKQNSSTSSDENICNMRYSEQEKDEKVMDILIHNLTNIDMI